MFINFKFQETFRLVNVHNFEATSLVEGKL